MGPVLPLPRRRLVPLLLWLRGYVRIHGGRRLEWQTCHVARRLICVLDGRGDCYTFDRGKVLWTCNDAARREEWLEQNALGRFGNFTFDQLETSTTLLRDSIVGL